MMIRLNKNKNIGKVLLIVEGIKTEIYLLRKIFTNIFDFQYEKLDRLERYGKFNEKEGIESSVFVINTEESAISYIDDSNEYLNELFERLIEEYNFPVDRAAIFYLFDRDEASNTNSQIVRELIQSLSNSRDNNGFTRQGLFLLSYPSVESFVASNFISQSHQLEFKNGSKLKQYLNEKKIYQHNINEESLMQAVAEMEQALSGIEVIDYNLDDFSESNLKVFEAQEKFFECNDKYRLISLLSILLIDLGLVEVENCYLK